MEEEFLREEDQEEERSLQHSKMRRNNVLHYQRDFNKVYSKGKSVGDKYVVVFCLKNNLDYNRISFLASKKVGNSVKRNRARRLMKESLRTSDLNLPIGYDFIIIARNTIDGKNCNEVKKSLENALKRTGVLNKK